jgi:SAM-dependent methyltransferase
MAEDDRTAQFLGKYISGKRSHRLMIGHFFAAVQALLEEASPASVLETGCGPGYSTAAIRGFLPADAKLEASDILPENLKLASEVAPGVPLAVESIYKLKREDASVDLVLCLEVLEHLDDPARAMRELVRVARRHLLLSVPREPMWRVLNCLRGKYLRDWGNTPGHLNYWGKRAFLRFVADYADVRSVRTPIPWTIVLAEKRT